MQALDLNLSTRPFRNNTVLWVGYGLMAVLLVVISVRHVQRFRENDLLLNDLKAQVDNIDVELSQLERRDRAAREGIGKFDVRSLTVQATKANEVIRWKSFSWTRLFNQLEAIQPHDVRMTSVRPIFLPEQRVAAGRAAAVDSSAVPVAVEGAAKSLDDFLDLERELLRDPSFSRIEPERSARAESTGETLFQLRFVYDPTPALAAAAAALAAPGDRGEGSASPDAGDPAELAEPTATSAGDSADVGREKSRAGPAEPTGATTEIRAEGWDRPQTPASSQETR